MQHEGWQHTSDDNYDRVHPTADNIHTDALFMDSFVGLIHTYTCYIHICLHTYHNHIHAYIHTYTYEERDTSTHTKEMQAIYQLPYTWYIYIYIYIYILLPAAANSWAEQSVMYMLNICNICVCYIHIHVVYAEHTYMLHIHVEHMCMWWIDICWLLNM